MAALTRRIVTRIVAADHSLAVVRVAIKDTLASPPQWQILHMSPLMLTVDTAELSAKLFPPSSLFNGDSGNEGTSLQFLFSKSSKITKITASWFHQLRFIGHLRMVTLHVEI